MPSVWERREELRQREKQTDRFRLFCKLIVTTIQAPQGLLGDIGNVILKLIWQRKCSKQPKEKKKTVKDNSEWDLPYQLSKQWPFRLKQPRDLKQGPREWGASAG